MSIQDQHLDGPFPALLVDGSTSLLGLAGSEIEAVTGASCLCRLTTLPIMPPGNPDGQLEGASQREGPDLDLEEAFEIQRTVDGELTVDWPCSLESGICGCIRILDWPAECRASGRPVLIS
jgi:hypothetical protein